MTAIRLQNVDLTGQQTYPHIDEIETDMPSRAYLAAYWRDALLTLDGANVEAWGSFGGYSATQATGSLQPDYAAGVVTGDGTDDYLATSLVPNAIGGYLVATIIPGTINAGAVRYYGGSQTSSTQRLSFGISSTGILQGLIGNVTLQASGAPTLGVEEVVGIAYDGSGACELRRNGASADTDTYTGGVGTLPFFLVARNFGGVSQGFNNWGIKGIAYFVKAGGLSDGEMDAIDAVMATL